ncbi:ABC transporter substrate-binding protein [Deinococcus rubellus]|uniref:Transporter substrate-binding domain-containing protein n=1 Tax=Deinococcus rubellus TaxID=1889240 RepID=A0ABY5YHF0_9DEIO|nr:transporter substrate-binding domain-containing protein [Deinococcus rubellus]UWX64240.1 transporter substrate-binding domain-containing protein [Deinococcus rubellus]
MLRFRIHLAPLALLGALTGLASPVQAAGLAQIQGKGQFKLAFSTAQPPLINQNGTAFEGFATELLSIIGKQMKVSNITWRKIGTPQALMDGLRSGNYDAVIDSQLPQPLTDVTLSKPLACTGGVILARPGGPTYDNELKGKRVAVVTGSSYFYYVRNLPFDKQINVFASDDQALLAFLTGKLDALVMDRYAALKMFKAAGAKVIQVSPLLWSQDITLVMNRSSGTELSANNEVLAPINIALKKMLADGSYTALSKKYFGQDVRCEL